MGTSAVQLVGFVLIGAALLGLAPQVHARETEKPCIVFDPADSVEYWDRLSAELATRDGLMPGMKKESLLSRRAPLVAKGNRWATNCPPAGASSSARTPWSVRARGQITVLPPQKVVNDDNYFTFRSMEAYRGFLDLFATGCVSPQQGSPEGAALTPAELANARRCIEKRGPKEFREFSQLYNQFSIEKLFEIYQQIFVDQAYSLDEIRAARTYHSMLESGAGVLNYIRSNRNTHTEVEWMRIVQMFGLRFLEGYDRKRAKSGPNQNGVVDLNDLMRTALHNEELRFRGRSASGPVEMSAAEFAGVCRDMMAAEGEMLKATGHFENIYILSYPVNGTRHATLFAESKEKKGSVYHLNYFSARATDRNVSDPFFTQSAHISMGTYVAHPAGRTVTMERTEFGKALLEMSAFGITEFDPMARSKSTYLMAELRPDPQSAVQFNAVRGTDGARDEYSALAATVQGDAESIFPVKLGGVVGVKHTDGRLWGDPNDHDYYFFYLHGDFPLLLRASISDRLEIESRTVLRLAGLIGGMETDEGFESSYQTDIHGKQELTLRWQATPTTRLKTRAGLIVSPGLLDQRARWSFDNLALVVDRVYGEVQLEQKLGDWALLAEALVATNSSLGTVGRFQLGGYHFNSGCKIFAGWEGKLDPQTSILLTGGKNQLFSGLVCSSRSLRAGVEFFQLVDPRIEDQDLSAQGFFEVKW